MKHLKNHGITFTVKCLLSWDMENKHQFCVSYTSHSVAFLSLPATCSPRMQKAHMDAADTNINLRDDYLKASNERNIFHLPGLPRLQNNLVNTLMAVRFLPTLLAENRACGELLQNCNFLHSWRGPPSPHSYRIFWDKDMLVRSSSS